MATCTFCGKPAEEEVGGGKGVCKVCAGKVAKVLKDELKEELTKIEEVKLRRRTPQQSCGACKAPSLG
jgi:hypothetical protein